MRVLDLFSGIGGFSLGLERAGMETVAFCEYDKKAQLVLKKHWPDVLIFDDVRKLNGKQFEGQTIDLICGGFPCQPFSVAGKRRGEEDDRHLWPEYFRLIQEIRPRWVIGENVAGLINMALDQVLSDLESENYSCQAVIIPACAVNAPHRRDRVWILANTIGGRWGDAENTEIHRRGLSNTPIHTSSHSDIMAYPKGKRMERGRSNREQKPPTPFSQRLSGCGSTGSERRNRPTQSQLGRVVDGISTGLDGHFDREPDIPRVATGIKGRVDRLKQLGNAVVPQVVEAIGRAIMEAEGF